MTYYVRKIDDFTIKLTTTPALAQKPAVTFAPSAASGNTITTASSHGFAVGDRVTYNAPVPLIFTSTGVDVNVNADGTLPANPDNAGANNIYVAGFGGLDANNKPILLPHNFVSGDRVIYRKQGTGAGIGLNDGQVYYVIVRPGHNYDIQLAETYDQAVGRADDPSTPENEFIPITPKVLTPIKSGADANVKHGLVREAIGGLQDGVTYIVRGTPSANQLQLSETGSTTLITFTSTGRCGTHSISPAGIDLASSSGTQKVWINLTSLGASATADHKLLGAGGVSLRGISPAADDGKSSASARGAGGGFVEYGDPDATLTARPTVKAWVAGQLLDAGGNVAILANSIGNVSAYARNAAGGVVKIGNADATTNFVNSNLALIGVDSGGGAYDATGTQIKAGRDFTLSADFSITNDKVDCIARGGGFLAFADAEANANINNQSRAIVGRNACITSGTALVQAIISRIKADAYGESKAGGFTGTSDADGFVRIGYDDGDGDPTDDLSGVGVALMQGARLTGAEGVDIRAVQQGIQIDGRQDSVFYGLSWGTGDSGEPANLSTAVVGDAGARVTAGPRILRPDPPVPTLPMDDVTPETRLAKPAGFDHLALYVEAAAPEDTRSVTWGSDVVILSGPSPTWWSGRSTSARAARSRRP